MQFLYSAFSLPKLAQSALHIITPGSLITSTTAHLPGEYNLLQGVAGNPGTMAISLSITRY